MKSFVAATYLLMLAGSIEAVGPVLSTNEWTPVPSSQQVRLPPLVLARHRAEEAAKNQQQASERYDVVDIQTEEVQQHQEHPQHHQQEHHPNHQQQHQPQHVISGVFVDSVGQEPEIIIREDLVRPQDESGGEQEQQQPRVEVESEVVEVDQAPGTFYAQQEPEEVREKEPEPVIVYPEGTLQQQQNRYAGGPAPVYERPDVQYPAQQQQQQQQQQSNPGPGPNPYPPPQRPQRPRLPPPPPNRRPIRIRRPPPSSYLPALSRNAPPPPQVPPPQYQERIQEGVDVPPQQRFEEPRPEGVPRPPLPPPPPSSHLQHQQQHNDNRGAPPPPRSPPPPPPRRPRPPPPRRHGGEGGGILGSLSTFAGGLKCKAEDIAVDIQLDNEDFIRTQLDCVIGQGPCDSLGSTIKRMAPDILKGHCPPPCDRCKKPQIQKVMSTIARKYPKEWTTMLKQVQGPAGRR